jgi:hypothetical protein
MTPRLLDSNELTAFNFFMNTPSIFLPATVLAMARAGPEMIECRPQS